MKKEAEERKLHRMAKVHDFLETWQGSHNLRVTHNESCDQHMQMTAVGYNSLTKEILNASWSHSQHDGAAALKFSERSPLQPPLSAKDHPGGQPKMLNFCRIRKINHHPVESHEDIPPGSISDTEELLYRNGD